MRGINVTFNELKSFIDKGYEITAILDSRKFKMRNNDIKIDRNKLQLTDENKYTEKIYKNMNIEELLYKHYLYVLTIVK